MTDRTLAQQLADARERGDGPEAARLEAAVAAQVPAPRGWADYPRHGGARFAVGVDPALESSAHFLVDVEARTVRQYLPVDPPEPPPLPAQVLEDARRIIDDPTPRQPSYGLRRRTPDELNEAEEAFVRQHFAAGTVVNSAALNGARKLAETPAAIATGRGLLGRALEPHPAPRSEALFGDGPKIGMAEEVRRRIEAGNRRLLAAIALARNELLEPHADHLVDVDVGYDATAPAGESIEVYRCQRCGTTATLEATFTQF